MPPTTAETVNPIQQDLLAAKAHSTTEVNQVGISQERGSSPQRTPGKRTTDPSPSHVAAPEAIYNKRLIICCDGTWQDGLTVTQRWKYTNVLRLARAVNHVDERHNPPIPQIVYYQSGVGTNNIAAMEILEGAVGATLGDKVQDAYGFLAHNYQPGDEIFLFGFSRGAYTARMVASFIGEIGILDRKDMDNFADIFLTLQKRGKAKDEKEKQKLEEKLKPWTHYNSPGRLQINSEQDGFSVKCIGVFDTVGAVGLPTELSFFSQTIKNLFGFPDLLLGHHVARAYHALALNENRKDFDCAKFHQTELGRKKGQVLKQCWFAGSHSDIGGGYEEHDLSDLALVWMAANVGDILSLDMKYLGSLLEPVADWGAQSPHDSSSGIFSIASKIHRQLPTQTDDITHETIHPSALRQSNLNPTLTDDIQKNPHLVASLLPLEEEVKKYWKLSTNKSENYKRRKSTQEMEANDKTVHRAATQVLKEGKDAEGMIVKTLTRTRTMSTEAGEPVYEKNRLGKAWEESSFGAFLKDLLGSKEGEV